MKILNVYKTTTLDLQNTFKDLTRVSNSDKWTVIYNMYGGVTYKIELNESEAMWVSENTKPYREKFDKAFTEALRDFLSKEINDAERTVLG